MKEKIKGNKKKFLTFLKVMGFIGFVFTLIGIVIRRL
jgi:hypothetical protein